MSEKKYLIILVLKILETNTDREHPITQVRLAEQIADVYPCDRKTVGRNIAFLQKVGYPIVKTTKGFYMAGSNLQLKKLILLCVPRVKPQVSRRKKRNGFCSVLRGFSAKFIANKIRICWNVVKCDERMHKFFV